MTNPNQLCDVLLFVCLANNALNNWALAVTLYKGINFCGFLFAFLWKGSIQKVKNLLPLGSNSFLFEQLPLQKKDKKHTFDFLSYNQKRKKQF